MSRKELHYQSNLFLTNKLIAPKKSMKVFHKLGIPVCKEISQHSLILYYLNSCIQRCEDETYL